MKKHLTGIGYIPDRSGGERPPGKNICNFKPRITKEKLGYLAALCYDGDINPIRQE